LGRTIGSRGAILGPDAPPGVSEGAPEAAGRGRPLAVEVALAIPVGLLLGKLWGIGFMSNVDKEMYRWAVVVAPRTYLLAAAVAVIAGAISALWVRRSLDRLDLIGVLKTRV
jgi:hypothetical protein